MKQANAKAKEADIDSNTTVPTKKTTKSSSKSASKSPAPTSKRGTKGKTVANGSSADKSIDNSTSLLEKFFFEQLKDIYFAELQQLKSIPTLEAAATTEELKEAFEDHLYQTHKQLKRLEKIFEITGKKPEGKKCPAIEGLIKESENIIKETKEGSMTRDAALIMAAQKIEHYEIATYGGLVQLALTMGLYEASEILDRTLLEEEEADCLLTAIAEEFINIEADGEMTYSWAILQEL